MNLPDPWPRELFDRLALTAAPWHYLAVVFAILAAPLNAGATWSINVADHVTGEVAVGTATCVNSINLLDLASVVVVGRGTGSSQSFVDVDGTRRATIFAGLGAATPPADIFTSLQALAGHETRQYGISDTESRTLTFTGSSAGPFADGVTGSSGALSYAIQGNLLTGLPVIQAAEQAVLTTPGDVPAKLMAAMEAARTHGGDGRCSCPGPDPTACGSPPASFTSSAINGGMIVARTGDTDDPVCNAAGCVDGDYFMRLDVAGQSFPNPDPVDQLRALFDAFRASLAGRPDAIRSQATVERRRMIVTLLDWRGLSATTPTLSLSAQHAPDSDGLAVIGAITDHGAGRFSIALTPSTTTGLDRFVVTADDGIRPVTLMPNPQVAWPLPLSAGDLLIRLSWVLIVALVLLLIAWLWLRRRATGRR